MAAILLSGDAQGPVHGLSEGYAAPPRAAPEPVEPSLQPSAPTRSPLTPDFARADAARRLAANGIGQQLGAPADAGYNMKAQPGPAAAGAYRPPLYAAKGSFGSEPEPARVPVPKTTIFRSPLDGNRALPASLRSSVHGAHTARDRAVNPLGHSLGVSGLGALSARDHGLGAELGEAGRFPSLRQLPPARLRSQTANGFGAPRLLQYGSAGAATARFPPPPSLMVLKSGPS